MSRKIINKNRFSWQEEDRFKLNYQMVFDDKPAGDAEKAPDIDKVLNEQYEKWRIEREKIRKESFEKGLQQGRKEGYDSAAAELDSRIQPLKKELKDAHLAWKQYQELLKPDLLNLVFDLSEKILGVPVTNGTMRNQLEEELRALLQEMDRATRPVLWVSQEDYDLVESLQKEYADTTGIVIRVSNHCNPGEFQLETNREKVVRDFRQMLKDFKDSLILPK